MTVDESTGGILWLFGKAGSGKSSMSSVSNVQLFPMSLEADQRRFIYRALLNWEDRLISNEKQLVLRFFLDSKLGQDMRSLDYFYPTLLYQLLSQVRDNCSTDVKLMCLRHVQTHIQARSPTDNDFKTAISNVLDEIGAIYLILDALDECKMQEGPALLLKWLMDQSMHPDLKTFITSRPEQRILTAQKEEERDHPKLHIAMSMILLKRKSNEDIRRLIEH